MLLRALAAGHGARLADGVQLAVGDERVIKDPRSILRLQAVDDTVRCCHCCAGAAGVTRDALVKVPATSYIGVGAGAIVEGDESAELAVGLADSTDGRGREAVGIRRVNSGGVQEVGGALAIGAVCESDGELSTNALLDNCASGTPGDGWDFYKRVACDAAPVIACMPSNDAHWIANDGYTQAELDSLRTNCPATCVNDAAGDFTSQLGGVATTQSCAKFAEDKFTSSIACSACSNLNAGGVCLVPLPAAECPASTTPALTEAARTAVPDCNVALAVGAICEADGNAPINNADSHNNCASIVNGVTAPGNGAWDFYKRVACHASSTSTAVAAPDGIVDCLETQDAARILDNPLITYGELDAIRKSCPVSCGECAKKHFYYPASLMNEVRLHCPKACSSSRSGTPFCHT